MPYHRSDWKPFLLPIGITLIYIMEWNKKIFKNKRWGTHFLEEIRSIKFMVKCKRRTVSYYPVHGVTQQVATMHSFALIKSLTAAREGKGFKGATQGQVLLTHRNL